MHWVHNPNSYMILLDDTSIDPYSDEFGRAFYVPPFAVLSLSLISLFAWCTFSSSVPFCVCFVECTSTVFLWWHTLMVHGDTFWSYWYVYLKRSIESSPSSVWDSFIWLSVVAHLTTTLVLWIYLYIIFCFCHHWVSVVHFGCNLWLNGWHTWVSDSLSVENQNHESNLFCTEQVRIMLSEYYCVF